MYLKKLEITGFKSFAQKTELIFDTPACGGKTITAIVGPNGSGKSNISDAIRWVLGEQSLKLLRGKSSEDVIFSGSETHRRFGVAEVCLTIDNHDKKAPIDYPIISISRKMYRNGVSEYAVNNSPARREDIILLLAKCGIAAKNYAVIGQGMVDSVLEASAFDRKDFFDEATGVKEFEIKKHKAENQLRNTSYHLEETSLLLKELKPRLASLEKQFKKYNERERLLKEYGDIQIAYYGGNMKKLAQSISEKQSEQSLLASQAQELKVKIAALQNDLTAMFNAPSGEEEYNRLHGKINHLQTQKSQIMQEHLTLSRELETEYENNGLGDIAWLNHRIDELSLLQKTYLSKLDELDGSLAIHEKSCAERERDKHCASEKLIRAKAHLCDLKKSMQTKIQNEEIARSLEEIIALHTSLASNIKNGNPSSSLTASLELIREKISVLLQRLSAPENSLVRANIAIEEEQIQSLSLQMEEYLHEFHELKLQTTIIKEKIDLLRAERERIEKELDALAIKREKQQGKNQSTVAAHKIHNKIADARIRLQNTERAIAEASAKIQSFHHLQENHKKMLVSLQQSKEELGAQMRHIESLASAIAIDLAKLTTKKDSLEQEVERDVDQSLKAKIYKYQNAEADYKQESDLLPKMLKIKKMLEFIGGTDESVIHEYRECKDRYTFLDNQRRDLEDALAGLYKIIKELEKKIAGQFEKNLSVINKNFNHYFGTIFSGGKAELKRVKKALDEHTEDIDIPQSGEEWSEKRKKETWYQKETIEGIEIFASPPGKKIQSIAILSGGEKSLVSIALICAIISSNPPPFVFFDEVDAALDEANSHRITDVIADLAHKTQFIAITHNRATMEKADILYGVTMKNDGVSQIFSLKVEGDGKQKKS